MSVRSVRWVVLLPLLDSVARGGVYVCQLEEPPPMLGGSGRGAPGEEGGGGAFALDGLSEQELALGQLRRSQFKITVDLLVDRSASMRARPTRRTIDQTIQSALNEVARRLGTPRFRLVVRHVEEIPRSLHASPIEARLRALEDREQRADVLVMITDGWESPIDLTTRIPDEHTSPVDTPAELVQQGKLGGWGLTLVYAPSWCASAAFASSLAGTAPEGWATANEGSCPEGLEKAGPDDYLLLAAREGPSLQTILAKLQEATLSFGEERVGVSARPAPMRQPLGPVTDFRPLEADQHRTVAAVGNDQEWICSGVLVGHNVLLTARHCLPATRVSFDATVEAESEIFSVSRSLSHPNPSVDLALLKLAEPLLLDPDPLRGARDQEIPMGTARAVGYGAVDPQGQRGYGRRHVTDLPAAGWGCDQRRERSTGCQSDWEMVLRSSTRDTCNGDSGGPVFESWVGSAEASLEAGLGPGERICGWRLLAITSRPVADARVACGSGGIYTRIDRAQPWLDENISALEATW